MKNTTIKDEKKTKDTKKERYVDSNPRCCSISTRGVTFLFRVSLLQELFSDNDWDLLLKHACTVVVDNKNKKWAKDLQDAMTTMANKLLGKMDRIPLRWL